MHTCMDARMRLCDTPVFSVCLHMFGGGGGETHDIADFISDFIVVNFNGNTFC